MKPHGPPVPLREDLLYRAPSGRRCQWLPDQHDVGPDVHTAPVSALFVYLDMPEGGIRRGAPSRWHDAFRLTVANWRLLRVVGRT